MLPSYMKRKGCAENSKSKKPSEVSRRGTEMFCVFLIVGRISKKGVILSTPEEGIVLTRQTQD